MNWFGKSLRKKIREQEKTIKLQHAVIIGLKGEINRIEKKLLALLDEYDEHVNGKPYDEEEHCL